MNARVVTITPSGTEGAGSCATTAGSIATVAITERMVDFFII
jgi:hypothetical protein